MAITNSDYLDDRVRVHIWCKRPWGVPDERSFVDVKYDVLMALSAPPPMGRSYGIWQEFWDEEVYIPTQNLTISFRFSRWQEADDCRMEALIGGPYLARRG